MKQLFTQFILLFLMATSLPMSLYAQNDVGIVRGVIKDNNGPVIGANVLVKGTGIGTITDFNGKYKLELRKGLYNLEVNYIGYRPEQRYIKIHPNKTTRKDFKIIEGINIDEVIIIGSRASNRTSTGTPVPIDIIDIERLSTMAPQVHLNQMLNIAAPAFSSNTQTLLNGTDHIDPASLRVLGPDQVLVLIDEKRRHTSSFININGTFGRGQVGTDLNAIPSAAIKSVEVLRDGASAQYGSDAIAGVINLRLHDDMKKLRLSINSGANFSNNASPQKEVDGEILDIGANYGVPLGRTGGFLNLTGVYSLRGWSNRMQEFSGNIFNAYNAVEWAAKEVGADISNLSFDDVKNYAQGVEHFSEELKLNLQNATNIKQLQGLLSHDVTEDELSTRGQIRSDYNMLVGQSALTNSQFFANMDVPLNSNLNVYAFGGMAYRHGTSGCFYRLPNQNNTYTPDHINGYIPKINSRILDRSAVVGLKSTLKSWEIDLSNTIGFNRFLYHMTETYNTSLQSQSPDDFEAGGHAFLQNTTNLDFSKYFKLKSLTGISFAAGAEYRLENFKVIPGDENSYARYDRNGTVVNHNTPDSLIVRDFFSNARPAGAQCFSGFLPKNEVNETRYNTAFYMDTEFDISDNFLLEGAIRYENFSDFGSTFNYKIATRLIMSDIINFRAAHSTGFRAPSLHQIHFSRTSNIFVTENGETNAQDVTVFSNNSLAAELLGIPDLKQETSKNFSAGITAKLTGIGLKITLDGYLVDINNRIILTGRFQANDDPELEEIFNSMESQSASFFANAINTRSKGVDIVITHKTILEDNVQLNNDFAATFATTERIGNINVSSLLEEKGLTDTYFNEESRIYLEEAIPRTKITLSHSLKVKDVNFYLRNTYFGATTEATNTTDPTINKRYSGKIITDCSVSFPLVKYLNLTLGANNLLDIYPDVSDPAFQSDGRFLYSRRSPQFSYNGRHLFARLAFVLDHRKEE